jgi:hypothetical protein
MLWGSLAMIGVGSFLPGIRTELADLPHQMWCTTFDAQRGADSYVALALEIGVVSGWAIFDRHTTK